MRLVRARRALAVAAAGAAFVAGGVVTVVSAQAAAAGCRVTYTVGSQWGNGFTGNVALTNLGDPLDGWRLTWTFPGNQQISQSWGGQHAQSGAAVTITNASWNAALATGASAGVGFNASYSGANAVPTSFALNGVTCTGATGPTTTPAGPTPTASQSTTPRPTTPPPSPTGPAGVPPAKTVRVFWLKPTDVAYDQRYPDGIAAVMRESQRYYRQELGRTFTLNSTVVEVVNGEHDRNWYINTNCPATGDRYWCVVGNMHQELMRRFGIANGDSRWLCVGVISAEDPGKSGGGASSGWVVLSGHDADGAAGINGPMNRWYGGMVHELGHAFGLPDSTSTDGTPMSASFYNYPNTHFSQAQKTAMLNGRYGSFLT